MRDYNSKKPVRTADQNRRRPGQGNTGGNPADRQNQGGRSRKGRNSGQRKNSSPEGKSAHVKESGLILNDTKALGKQLGLKERTKTVHHRPVAGGSRSRGGQTPKKKAENLKILPIGGLNEIGKNMTALEYRDQIILIDCGMSFPEDEMYGIDVVIPDFSYLIENAAKVKGVLITHGHEDHIGGVPYLLKQIDVPIYGTQLPLGLIQNKLNEHGLNGDLRPIKAGDVFKIGNFRIEAIHTTHSIADAVCYCIETPAARVFHTGDFKIDYTPIDGEPIDLQKLAEIGARGVDLMMADSTNVLRPGFTPSERVVGQTLDGIFRQAKNRIIIATFSSNVHRVQTIIELAVKYGRKFTVSGRSMENVVKLAVELGYLKYPEGTYVELNQTRHIPDRELVIITTGSQGEPMSALSRMAADEHRNVKLKKGDMVILSSTPVPGNEKTVSNVVNKLYEKEVQVIYNDIADIHVSGHACQEDLKLMHTLIKPKFFMPVHGEHRHLIRHAELAEELGMKKENIFILENGDQLTVDHRKAIQFRNVVPAEDILVDGLGIGDVGNIVLRDRKQLSESGLVIITAAVDRRNGIVISGPEIVSRGFVYVKEHEELMTETREQALRSIEKNISGGFKEWNTIKNGVRDDMRKFIFKVTRRSPIILPIFLDVEE